MKIGWYSNAPWTGTGYGTQTAQVVRRLRDDGHDVAIYANHGLMGMVAEWEGIPVYPGGSERYSTDVLPLHHQTHLGDDDGWLISLYDVWVLRELPKGTRAAFWTPVDHEPCPPAVLDWARGHRTIAMSKFGQQALKVGGVDAAYIPHALDRTVWQPRESNFRSAMGIPADAFLVSINAANEGLPPRKSWWEMLAGFASFATKHADAWLYIHTDLARVSGVNIPFWLRALGLNERVRWCGQHDYRTGTIPSDAMAQMYTASDVLLSTSRGEGFGLAVLEAQACGTPVVVTDFSAQRELVGAGWRVGYQLEPDWAQGSLWAIPKIPEIAAALDLAYERRGDPELRQQALDFAAGYDADLVYDTLWRPYLRQLEAELAPPTRQQRRAAARRSAA